jgi:hypothetical protein
MTKTPEAQQARRGMMFLAVLAPRESTDGDERAPEEEEESESSSYEDLELILDPFVWLRRWWTCCC